MDLRFTPEEIAFRDEVRTFFHANLPESIRTKLLEGKHLAKDDIITWQRILNKRGWAVANWPVQWGGTGWTPVQQYIFQDELQQTPAPQPLGFGVTMVGPVMIAFGSEAQKKRFLPRIANLDDWWCQGFSEPGAGSDLASLADRGQARRRLITSSTARRRGRPWRSTPTGSFAWCAPTRRPRSRKASRFC